MQSRIIGSLSVEEVFPPASDLPESISDSQLQLDYGGVNGRKYLEIVKEIERRLVECSALQ
jgi:hypothetical protein